MAPLNTAATRWARNPGDVTTTKLPPPPHCAQKRAGSVLLLIVTSEASARTISALVMLFKARPKRGEE